jgi:hypothetical protein
MQVCVDEMTAVGYRDLKLVDESYAMTKAKYDAVREQERLSKYLKDLSYR